VRTYFVVHDLLPFLRPEWFTRRSARNYKRWLRTLAVLGDGAICTTKTGAEEFRRLAPAVPVTWFHLGSDIESSVPTAGRPAAFDERLRELRKRTNILMVGTIEPRKAYGQALAAFDSLWTAGEEVNLLIVGRVGWKSEELVASLRRHPERGRRLHWFDDATDEMLRELYALADGVLVASLDEGFGLPVIEAAKHGKPLLLRDVPVFREIAGGHCRFFAGEELAAEMAAWLPELRSGSAVPSTGLRPLTWKESARALLGELRKLGQAARVGEADMVVSKR
jgi:glycosyltransferase involved in cell wall biosynthesis